MAANRSNGRRSSETEDRQKRKYDEMEKDLSTTKEKLKRTEAILDDVIALEYRKTQDGKTSAAKDGTVQFYCC